MSNTTRRYYFNGECEIISVTRNNKKTRAKNWILQVRAHTIGKARSIFQKWSTGWAMQQEIDYYIHPIYGWVNTYEDETKETVVAR